MDIEEMRKQVASYNGRQSVISRRKKLGKKGFSEQMRKAALARYQKDK